MKLLKVISESEKVVFHDFKYLRLLNFFPLFFFFFFPFFFQVILVIWCHTYDYELHCYFSVLEIIILSLK